MTAFYKGVSILSLFILFVSFGPAHGWLRDFNTIRPIQLIEKLKQKSGDTYEQLTYSQTAAKGWVKESDLKSLIPLIESGDSCKCLISGLSSYYARQQFSTVGGMACEMIESYMENSIFPKSMGGCYKTDASKVSRIKKWWNEHQQ